jgi:isocitrate dehydrogenase
VVEPNAKGEYGILTRRDIVAKIVRGSRNPATTRVGEIASYPVVSVPADTSLREAAALIADSPFSRLTVSQGDRLIGIVTATDLFEAIEKFGWAFEAA